MRRGGPLRQACRLVFGAAALAGCAPIPPPSVLSDVERARVAPQVTEARDGAEAAMAKAESLRQRANEALAAGDYAGAQLLGEQALVAYEAVAMTARAAKALARAADATAETEASERELAALEATLQQVRADVAALEGRLVSSQLAAAELAQRMGAEPAPALSADAQDAALASELVAARLSCMTAELVRRTHAPSELEPASLDAARKLLAAAGAASAKTASAKPARAKPASAKAASAKAASAKPASAKAASAKAAPADELAVARRAREACLDALDEVRRGLADVKRATGGADALLEALSDAGLEPRRDERGVVVTLRGSFAGDELTAVGRSALEKLAKAAKPFAGTPLVLVVHEPLERTADPAARGEARGRLVSSALAADLGDGAIGATLHAGMATPVVDPQGKHAARNRRVELVFVTRQAI